MFWFSFICLATFRKTVFNAFFGDWSDQHCLRRDLARFMLIDIDCTLNKDDPTDMSQPVDHHDGDFKRSMRNDPLDLNKGWYYVAILAVTIDIHFFRSKGVGWGTSTRFQFPWWKQWYTLKGFPEKMNGVVQSNYQLTKKCHGNWQVQQRLSVARYFLCLKDLACWHASAPRTEFPLPPPSKDQ